MDSKRFLELNFIQITNLISLLNVTYQIKKFYLEKVLKIKPQDECIPFKHAARSKQRFITSKAKNILSFSHSSDCFHCLLIAHIKYTF
jgi:hypothetical protein